MTNECCNCKQNTSSICVSWHRESFSVLRRAVNYLLVFKFSCIRKDTIALGRIVYWYPLFWLTFALTWQRLTHLAVEQDEEILRVNSEIALLKHRQYKTSVIQKHRKPMETTTITKRCCICQRMCSARCPAGGLRWSWSNFRSTPCTKA